MRAFIAVDISAEVRSALGRVVSELQVRIPGARWVRPEGLHLTLRFLGETEEKTLAGVAQGLEAIAARFAPFSLRYRGLGFFPSARRPRVLWVGMDNPPPVLASLQREVEGLAGQLGFAAEDRPFSPHLTLARFKEPRPRADLLQLEAEFGESDFGVSPAEALSLYQSILKPSGALYRALGRFPLARGKAAR